MSPVYQSGFGAEATWTAYQLKRAHCPHPYKRALPTRQDAREVARRRLEPTRRKFTPSGWTALVWVNRLNRRLPEGRVMPLNLIKGTYQIAGSEPHVEATDERACRSRPCSVRGALRHAAGDSHTAVARP